MNNKNKKRRSAIPEVPAARPYAPPGSANKNTAKSVAGQANKQDSDGGGWFTFKNIRESLESLAIACILAFLFRTFEAEAFTIPTGSMAVTLMGEHKDLPCPKCGHWFQAGDSEGSRSAVIGTPQGPRMVYAPVTHLTCPICRNQFEVNPQTNSADRSFNGDHILISKFAYLLDDPHRWDVAVFRFPGNAKMNYIKRIVGLPNEQLRIHDGNIYTRPAGDSQAKFQIARKQAFRAKAMLQLVDDDHCVPEELAAAGWPSRWQAEQLPAGDPADGSAKKSNWQIETKEPEQGNIRREYVVPAIAGDTPVWLRYRHYTPTEDDWKLIAAKRPIVDLGKRPPRLIDDFNGYNAVGRASDKGADQSVVRPNSLGLHWVGDLAVEAELEVDNAKAGGALLLDLVEAGRHFTCRIDTDTGKATLLIDGGANGFVDEAHEPVKAFPTADTPISAAGTYRVRFANIDDQLLLWVNEREIAFDAATTYQATKVLKPATSDQDPGDLAPIGIGSQGAALRVKHLRVLRDIYYLAVKTGQCDMWMLCDYKLPEFLQGDAGLWDQSKIGNVDVQTTDVELRRLLESQFTDKLPPKAVYIAQGIRQVLGDPALWTKSKLFDSRRTVEFEQGADQYFPLGDNSPESSDARIWSMTDANGRPAPLAHWIPRDSIKGKALFVYWPHPWRSPIPLIPNFPRMGVIR